MWKIEWDNCNNRVGITDDPYNKHILQLLFLHLNKFSLADKKKIIHCLNEILNIEELIIIKDKHENKYK